MTDDRRAMTGGLFFYLQYGESGDGNSGTGNPKEPGGLDRVCEGPPKSVTSRHPEQQR